MPKIDRTYYIATEIGYIDNLNKMLLDTTWKISAQKHVDDGQKLAAILVGNSYILNTIALLPEVFFNTIYICDLDEKVLNYTKRLIQCVAQAQNYDAFKVELTDLNRDIDGEPKPDGHILNFSYYGYDYDTWVEERYLSRENFSSCVSIHHTHPHRV